MSFPSLLTALLVANKVVGYVPKSLSRAWIVVPLLAGLLVAYGLPFTRVPGEPALVGAMVAIVFAVPVVFAVPERVSAMVLPRSKLIAPTVSL